MPIIVNRLDKKAYGDYIEFPVEELISVYSGVFSFKYIYYILREWFMDNGYANPKESEFKEDLYSQRDAGGVKEIWVRWRLRKETGDYYINAYEIDMIMHGLALSETEVLVGGKKMKMDKGEVEFKFLGRMMINPDYSKAWYNDNKAWYNPMLKKWFASRHILAKTDFHGGAFLSDLNRLLELIKEYFDVERYGKTRELMDFYKGRLGE